MRIKSASLFVSILLSLLLSLSSAGYYQNQALGIMGGHLGQSKIDEIVGKLKTKCPPGWEVNKVEENAVPDLWDQDKQYHGYKIGLQDQDPNHTFEKPSKVSSMKSKYRPSYTLWFIPLSSGLTLDKAIRDFNSFTQTRVGGQGVLVIACLYGASDQYLLIYKKSDKTSWDNGLVQIANEFGIRPIPESMRIEFCRQF